MDCPPSPSLPFSSSGLPMFARTQVTHTTPSRPAPPPSPPSSSSSRPTDRERKKKSSKRNNKSRIGEESGPTRCWLEKKKTKKCRDRGPSRKKHVQLRTCSPPPLFFPSLSHSWSYLAEDDKGQGFLFLLFVSSPRPPYSPNVLNGL